jgi:GNAT superfamily N-acetyltransferase
MPTPTTTATPVTATAMPAMLRRHLIGWAGALPAGDELLVVASARNAQPGWDDRPQLLTGIADPAGRTVVAVPPAAAADLSAHHQPGRGARTLELLPGLLGRVGHTVERVAFRWTVAPADLPGAGVWVDTASPRLPDWLRPFGGQALVAFDEHGDYLAGVGIKRHDELGHEISVGTEPRARGRGLARRLVAQAAKHILDEGRIPTYLHTFDNLASSRVAAAAGFPDGGWCALMLSDVPATPAAASSRVAADLAA